jgi:hypothetical protein
MNMSGRPDLLQKIEILDGEHFIQNSLAQFCFWVVSAPDANGFSLAFEGEVFRDSIAVYNGTDVVRSDDLPSGYENDGTARRIVATNLFSYDYDATEVSGDSPAAAHLDIYA